MQTLRQDADRIIEAAIHAALPDTAVKKALKEIAFPEGGRLILVATGKAAWQMAKAAWDEIGGKVDRGVVVTKYDHSKGAIGNPEIYDLRSGALLCTLEEDAYLTNVFDTKQGLVVQYSAEF